MYGSVVLEIQISTSFMSLRFHQIREKNSFQFVIIPENYDYFFIITLGKYPVICERFKNIRKIIVYIVETQLNLIGRHNTSQFARTPFHFQFFGPLPVTKWLRYLVKLRRTDRYFCPSVGRLLRLKNKINK